MITLLYNGILVSVLVYIGVTLKRRMYQCKADVDMLNAVKSMLADVSSVSPSSELWRKEKGEGEDYLMEIVHTLFVSEVEWMSTVNKHSVKN